MKTKLICILTISFVTTAALADAGLTLRGRLLKPDGTPVTAPTVQFKVQVRTPTSSDCLMFEEVHTKDLSASDGLFVITLNDGTATGANSEAYTLEKAFSALGTVTFPAGKCSASSTVALTESVARRIVVAFNDTTFAGWENLPPITTNFAGQSLASVSVGGFRSEELFRVTDGSGAPHSLGAWSVANYTKLTDLITNTTIAGGNASIGGNAAGFTGDLSGDVEGAQGSTSVVRLRGQPVSSMTPTFGEVLTWDGSVWKGATPASLPPATLPGQFLKSTGTAWLGQDILFSDIKSSTGGPAFSVAACGADETVNWSSLTDRFECQSIGALDASIITQGTLDPSRLPAAVMSGMWSSSLGDVYRTSGKVGIGTSTPTAALDVVGATRVQGSLQLDGGLDLRASDGMDTSVGLEAYGTFAKPKVMFKKASGSATAPLPVTWNESLGEVSWHAYDGSSFRQGARISGTAAENWLSGAMGTKIRFFVTPNGTTVPQIKMTLADTGFLGVGTDSPTKELDVVGGGQFSGEVHALGFTYTSDLRFKQDVVPLSNSLAKLLNFRGVSYHWRVDEFPEKRFNDRPQIGLIAQDVEKQFPELVMTDSAGYKSVNYSALVAPIIEAIRELYAKYVSQEERLEEQDRKIQDLERMVFELKRDVACQKDPASENCR